MKISRGILAFLNLVLGAMLAFGVLFLIERLMRQNWVWYSRVLACWPILLCWAVGLAARRLESLRIPLLAAALVLAAVVMGLFLRSFGFSPFFLALRIAKALMPAMIKARTKNAPGLAVKIAMGSHSSFVTVKPKMVPAPRNSRRIPISVSPSVKPSPMPIPSNTEGITGFLDA